MYDLSTVASPGFCARGDGVRVHEIRQKSQKFLHKYKKTGKRELTRYTTVNLWLEWENVWCSVYHSPLDINVTEIAKLVHTRWRGARAP